LRRKPDRRRRRWPQTWRRRWRTRAWRECFGR